MDDNIKLYYPTGISQKESDSIYENVWRLDFYNRLNLYKNGMESIAGYGTTKSSLRIIVNSLPSIFKKYNIRTFLDAACADYYSMKDVNFNGIHYIGIDMIDEQIKMNKEKYKNVDFRTINMMTDIIPSVDLVFSRDTMIHMSSTNIFRFLKNCINSNCQYLMATTFPELKENIELGGQLGWRNLNLEISPYNFPSIEVISEKYDINPEKCMGIWKFSDINKIINK